MSKLTKETEWLRANVAGRPVGVDREARVIRGYVVAQLGPFKTPGRGEFDGEALATIASMMNAQPSGLKARFSHPTLSSDGLGKYLGRSRNASVDGDRVRADLHLAESASHTPSGDLAGYVMDLAAEDSDALSSSLVLQTEKIVRLGDDGRPKRDDNGQDLPPLWRPTKLHASDIVDTGEAVDGLLGASLSVDGLPDDVVRMGTQLLDQQFSGCPREVVQARALAFLERYLAHRYGEADETADLEWWRRKLRLAEFRSNCS